MSRHALLEYKSKSDSYEKVCSVTATPGEQLPCIVPSSVRYQFDKRDALPPNTELWHFCLYAEDDTARRKLP